MPSFTPPTIPGYRIKKTIGKGGMAVVYLAIQESLDRPVALKLLSDPDTPQFHERFMNEGRCIAALGHSSVVPIHDIGWVGDHYYISMEYLPSGDLKTRIAKGVKPATALKIAAKIAGCLDYVHRQGIVHRDLKPSNILFRSDGTPILTDFGIAKMAQIDNELTITGTVLGSPHYLSPEQANGMKTVDGRSDLYSLGIILFEMLTGEKPFQSESFAGTVIAHLNDPVPRLPETLRHIQPLLERLLAKKPEERYQTGGDLVQAIQDLTQDKEPLKAAAASAAMPITPTDRHKLTDITRTLPIKSILKPSNRVKVAMAGGIVAIFVFATGLTAFYTGEDPEPETIAVQRPDARQPDPVLDSNISTVASPLVRTRLGQDAEKQNLPVPIQTIPPTSVTPPVAPAAKSDPNPKKSANTPAPEKPVKSAAIPRPTPAAKPGPGVDDLLKLAHQRYEALRLSVPAKDSALYYYREALRRDPENQQARSGLNAVANRYASLARHELSRNHPAKASRYVRQGLSIRADNPELIVLRNQLAQRKAAATNVWQHPVIRDHRVVDKPANPKGKSEVFDPLAGFSE